VVVVVDADGRPAPDCLAVCAADHLFGDAKVGAVQVDVRMLNCGMPAPSVGWGRRYFGRALVRMQDLEFRVAIAAIQMSRRFTGSVAMGGNGQFTRLSALDSIAGPHGQPWRGSLLEDFELGVYLLTEGWRTRFTVDTHVAQEALYSLRRLLAQRTRWDQGAMQCARHVPRIWHSPYVSLVGFAEMMYYLAQPWMRLLGTLIYPVPLLLLAVDTLHDSELTWRWFTASGWVACTVAGSCGLLPFLVWGPIYWVRWGRSGSPLRGLIYGAVYAMYVNLFYLTSWRAFTRLLRGHNSWAKTRRNRELDGVVTIYH
jgi:cellulose synthase/poly-beta-1,6-N-acetylglucosamine synthase-like glycosyltransferase